MRGSLLRAVPSAGAVGLLASATLGIDTTPSWETPEVVAAVGTYFINFALAEGQNRCLAFDHHGEAGVAFADDVTARYARRSPGVGWQAADIEVALAPVGQPTLAFDLAEQPRVGYVVDDSTPVDSDQIRIAALLGMTWTAGNVTSFFPGTDRNGEQFSNSVAIDITGRTMVAFTVGGTLRFGEDSDNDGLFNDEIAVNVYSSVAPNGPASASLAVDPLNRPMVAAAHDDGATLRFAIRDVGTGWQSIELDTSAAFPSLAIDPDTGFPAVAYFDTIGEDLIYAEWDGDQWVATSLDTAGSTGWWPSLAFDPADGNPAVAYHDSTGGDLRLAWHDGVQWNTQTVVEGTIKVPFGFTPSLAFDDFGTGFPAIAYFGIDSNLYFIEDPPRLGDLDGDGAVGIVDFLILIGSWGQTGSPADLDGDGTVGLGDFLILLGNWG